MLQAMKELLRGDTIGLPKVKEYLPETESKNGQSR
jgi:hypothetical protein